MWSYSAPPDFPLTLSVTGFSANAPGWRPLVYLGETSCSLYVVHVFILSALYSVKSPRIAAVVPSAIRDLLVFVAVLVAASVLYHFAEAPSREFICRAFAGGDANSSWNRVKATKAS
jgi:peptidoglycan/LPS O-acetylase OafA/YrhL